MQKKRISGPPSQRRWRNALLGETAPTNGFLGETQRDASCSPLQLFHTESLGPFTLDDFALLNQCTWIPKVEIKMSPRKRRKVFATCNETTSVTSQVPQNQPHVRLVYVVITCSFIVRKMSSHTRLTKCFPVSGY